MNVDNMRAVANLIELEDRFNYGFWVADPADEDFDDETTGAAWRLDKCGTTGCVAGWAAYMALREGFDGSQFVDIQCLAAAWLGIDHGQARRLFLGHHFDEDGWVDITAVEAAKFLRSVADGEVEL